MTRVFQHKTNKKTYGLTQIVDNDAYLIDVNTDERKTITLSTLHRYYEEVQPVANKTNKYPYYRHYERNQKPLWNTQTVDDTFYCCAEDGTKIIKCTLSKTAICIRIEQVATKAKRYFTNFNRAKKHLVYDQDIKTTQYISEKFDKWLKAQQKRTIKGDK